ncbi:hypothetical protein [Pricia sp.]|uniref:hypothetical protein n=1 Tax=Pricia sp. TaxID=2268138 RepID=UPI003593DB4A
MQSVHSGLRMGDIHNERVFICSLWNNILYQGAAGTEQLQLSAEKPVILFLLRTKKCPH